MIPSNANVRKAYQALLATKTPKDALRMLSDRYSVSYWRIRMILNPNDPEREPVAHALFRGMTRVNLTQVDVTLFWEDNRLKASLASSVSHKAKMDRFDIEVVGTYSKGADLQDVYDDIMEFYKEGKA